MRAEKVGKGGKNKAWSAVVHVVLVQARSLMAMDAGQSSDPYCKISLGRERFKSKSVSATVNPKWREAFDLYWYEEEGGELEISIWDKDVGSADDFMGKYEIDRVLPQDGVITQTQGKYAKPQSAKRNAWEGNLASLSVLTLGK